MLPFVGEVDAAQAAAGPTALAMGRQVRKPVCRTTNSAEPPRYRCAISGKFYVKPWHNAVFPVPLLMAYRWFCLAQNRSLKFRG